MHINVTNFIFLFLWIIEQIYSSKRSYGEGDQKPIQKKGWKQKQTSLLDELENAQNQWYKYDSKYDCINKKFKILMFKIKIQ